MSKSNQNKVESDHPVCRACTTCNTALQRMGLNLDKWDYMVALAGNPNTGKSTVFNAMTGLRQHTGNWPGKTVTRAEGGFQYQESRYKVVDLPGTYSLLSTSTDEEIARDFILFGQPDCMVIVVDATCLERNLNLVLQILEISGKVVIALNLMDEAKRKGIDIDAKSLSFDLGVPVIPTIAKTGAGLPELLESINGISKGKIKTKPHRIQNNGALQSAVSELVPLIEEHYPGLPNARWIAIRLLDGDPRIREALLSGELDALVVAR